MLVVINGVSGSGKDEFIKQLDLLSIITIHNESTINPIKDVMLSLGWNGDKTNENRQLMVDLKKAWIRWNHFACVNYVESIYHKVSLSRSIMFIHCREPEEIRKIVNRIPGTITLLIKGRGTKLNNGADNIVDGYDYDYNVINSGTVDDLRYSALKFVEWLTYHNNL